MGDPKSPRGPLDEFETLEAAHDGLDDLDALRARLLPVVLMAFLFTAGVTWLDAGVTRWGRYGTAGSSPFEWILLTLWTLNAILGAVFLLIARKAWLLRTALRRFYSELASPTDSERSTSD